MDAFAMVQALLPGVELTPGQLAQVRALNREYYQRLYALLHRAETEHGRGGTSGGDAAPEQRAPTRAEMAELEAALASSLREMLSEAQRAEFDRRRGE